MISEKRPEIKCGLVSSLLRGRLRPATANTIPDTGSAKALKEGFSVPRDRRPRRKFTSQISESEARFVDAVKTTPVTL